MQDFRQFTSDTLTNGIEMDKITEDGYRVTDTHVFFYKKWLSNFGRCLFKWNCIFEGDYIFNETNDDYHINHGEQFWCTEQAFMWAKAIFFGDYDTAKKILDEKEHPSICKNLGREVKNYDDDRWEKVRYRVMMGVNYAKYNQNKDLLRKLYALGEGKRTFVEASPIDCIWGVGMELTDDRIVDPKNWRGRNLLGQAITEALDKILLSGMLTVGQLIEHLGKYDKDAYILVGEMNAGDEGFWQHYPTDMVGHCVRSVSEEKKRQKEFYPDEDNSKDFIYAKDNDVIIRF